MKHIFDNNILIGNHVGARLTKAEDTTMIGCMNDCIISHLEKTEGILVIKIPVPENIKLYYEVWSLVKESHPHKESKSCLLIDINISLNLELFYKIYDIFKVLTEAYGVTYIDTRWRH